MKDRFLEEVDKEYQGIINYDEIINFSSTQISIRIKNKILIFEGNNLVINKMLDDEILITGNITNIRINK